MWKIGNVEINNRLVLAPMAGIGNSAFRRIVKKHGVALIFAEMVSDKAIVFNNQKSLKMLKMTDEERPIAQQIFGSDKESFVEAAKKVEQLMKPDIIDINLGCPVPKVAIRAQAGAGLLKHPKKVYELVKAVVEAVSIPVTVKIRSGWDDNNINAVEIAQACEKAGAKGITIHGRSRKQSYSGKVDLEIIKKVKENVKIPVIGNGDIKDEESALKMLEYCKVDAIMIGRAALGNPWIFSQIQYFLENSKLKEKPSPREIIETALLHIKYLREIKDDKIVVLEMRTHLPNYVKNLKKSKDFKKRLYQSQSIHDIISLLSEYLKDLESGD